MDTDRVAKNIVNSLVHKAIADVTKAKSGDTKMIFGKPFKYDGGKWVPSSGGGKKEDGRSKIGPSVQEKIKNKREQDQPVSAKDKLEDLVDTKPKQFKPTKEKLDEQIKNLKTLMSRSPEEKKKYSRHLEVAERRLKEITDKKK